MVKIILGTENVKYAGIFLSYEPFLPVKFKILTTATKMAVFWNVAPVVDRVPPKRLSVIIKLYGTSSQKATIFMFFTAGKTGLSWIQYIVIYSREMLYAVLEDQTNWALYQGD